MPNPYALSLFFSIPLGFILWVILSLIVAGIFKALKGTRLSEKLDKPVLWAIILFVILISSVYSWFLVDIRKVAHLTTFFSVRIIYSITFFAVFLLFVIVKIKKNPESKLYLWNIIKICLIVGFVGFVISLSDLLNITYSNTSNCKFISDARFRNKCFYEKVLATNDISYCYEINNLDLLGGDRCTELAASQDNSFACKRISDNLRTSAGHPIAPEANEYRCFMQLSLKSGKFYCDEIRDRSYADTCYVNIARQTGELDICKNLENKSPADFTNLEMCYQGVAVNKENPQICEMYKDVINRNSTIQKRYAGEIDKYTIDYMNFCFAKIFEKTKDNNFCSQSSKAYSDQCLKITN